MTAGQECAKNNLVEDPVAVAVCVCDRLGLPNNLGSEALVVEPFCFPHAGGKSSPEGILFSMSTKTLLTLQVTSVKFWLSLM